jgi:4-hydroxy-2-oxoheptanedioate aldolase
MTKSRVLQKLRQGSFVKVAGVSRVTDPWLIEVIGRVGYDVVWFDMEHRAFGFDKIDPISLACRASAEEARQWVEWVRFPPAGKRGLDGAGADSDFGFANLQEYLKHANEQVFLALQIEDKEAVDRIEEIVTVEGFDLVFIGPGDLSLSYGVPLQFDHPFLQKATERIAEAVKRAGKWWGTTTATPEAAQRALDMGARMVTAGGDHHALVNGFKTSFQQFERLGIRS